MKGLRLRVLKKLCTASGHRDQGRTAHIIDGQTVLLCNQCGEKVK